MGDHRLAALLLNRRRPEQRREPAGRRNQLLGGSAIPVFFKSPIRSAAILKVTAEIVRQQESFLEHGREHLRPLNLRTVADAIGVHESTVSRVTSNKYLATPSGVFELKFFFTSALQAVDGSEAHSLEAVRHLIKTLIDGEGKLVLSDDRLVDRLKDSGIEVGRRTVAEYREGMRIPSSMERRRRLQAAG